MRSAGRGVVWGVHRRHRRCAASRRFRGGGWRGQCRGVQEVNGWQAQGRGSVGACLGCKGWVTTRCWVSDLHARPCLPPCRTAGTLRSPLWRPTQPAGEPYQGGPREGFRQARNEGPCCTAGLQSVLDVKPRCALGACWHHQTAAQPLAPATWRLPAAPLPTPTRVPHAAPSHPWPAICTATASRCPPPPPPHLRPAATALTPPHDARHPSLPLPPLQAQPQWIFSTDFTSTSISKGVMADVALQVGSSWGGRPRGWAGPAVHASSGDMPARPSPDAPSPSPPPSLCPMQGTRITFDNHWNRWEGAEGCSRGGACTTNVGGTTLPPRLPLPAQQVLRHRGDARAAAARRDPRASRAHGGCSSSRRAGCWGGAQGARALQSGDAPWAGACAPCSHSPRGCLPTALRCPCPSLPASCLAPFSCSK